MTGAGGRPWPFEGKLQLVALDDGGRPVTRGGRTLWAVAAPFAYRTRAGDLLTLPLGMPTDLASIPRWASSLLPPDGPWVQIAVFHDLLYETRGSGAWRGKPYSAEGRAYTRAEADQVLKDGMADLGIDPWRRWVIWSAVRLGGGLGWGS